MRGYPGSGVLGRVIGRQDVPNFTDSGFRPAFQDASNQVRHFAGALVAGARHGGLAGRLLNTGREFSTLGSGGGMADVYLGNEAATLGDMIMTGQVRPDQVADIIRRAF